MYNISFDFIVIEGLIFRIIICMIKCIKKTIKWILILLAVLICGIAGFLVLQKYWGKMSFDGAAANFEIYEKTLRDYAEDKGSSVR